MGTAGSGPHPAGGTVKRGVKGEQVAARAVCPVELGLWECLCPIFENVRNHREPALTTRPSRHPPVTTPALEERESALWSHCGPTTWRVPTEGLGKSPGLLLITQ